MCSRNITIPTDDEDTNMDESEDEPLGPETSNAREEKRRQDLLRDQAVIGVVEDNDEGAGHRCFSIVVIDIKQAKVALPTLVTRIQDSYFARYGRKAPEVRQILLLGKL